MAIVIIIVLILLYRRWRLDRRTQQSLARIEARLGTNSDGN